MQPKSDSTEKLFNDIAQFVAESRALLEAGAMMELAGLDEQVRTLCDAVLQLSQDERILYSGRLQQLLGELKALGDTMVEQRDHLADEIRTVSQHKKANTAYRIVEASDESDNKDTDEEEPE